MKLRRLNRSLALCALVSSMLIAQFSIALAQTAPNLGSAASYGAYTGAGAIENTGLTVITGDIGTHVGSFTGFPPGIYTGTKNIANAATLAAKNDLILAYNSMNDAEHAVMYDTVLNATMGNGQVLTPRTYRRGDLTTIGGNLTFDAKGNPEAVFIIKIGAALDVAANTQIILKNSARAANIYWAVDGAVSILDNSVFKGTIVSDGAIHLYGGSSLEGRALAVVGAVTFASNMVSVPDTTMPPPDDSLVVITPRAGDTVRSSTTNYQITWTGTGIASIKTFDYSLDSGMTWIMIGGTSTDGFTYNWNVPDTISNTAFVRVTDANNLRGISGLFVIARPPSTSNIIVVRPSLGEIITGGTQGYAITWTGTGIADVKALSLSLDSGATWSLIGAIDNDSTTYSWNVPDTSTSRAIIRIIDANGIEGKSGWFTITQTTPIPSSIVVHHPVVGEIINGGYQNFLITFTAVNTTQQKTFEYSLDGGTTWTTIGVANSDEQFYTWPSVPNVATTQALVRITDSNGVVGTSGLFTITTIPEDGSIDGLFLTGLDENSNIDNSRTLGISWTYTPDIGTSVNVEYSLDYTATWVHIATVQIADPQNTTWTTPATGYHNPVFVRVTSTKGMTRASSPFSVGTQVSTGISDVVLASGLSMVNYPNPASSESTINFALPTPSYVTITVVDNRGSLVGTVTSQYYNAGIYTMPFNTSQLAIGVYSYILQAGATRVVSSMSVIK